MTCRRTAIILALALLFGAIETRAQQPTPKLDITHYEEQVKRCQQTIETWHRDVGIQIALLIAITVFGVVISVLQGLKYGWCKVATVVLGAATSIITIVSTTVFSADYRFLKRSTIDAQELTDQLGRLVDRLRSDPTPNDRLEIEGKWGEFLSAFHAVEKQVIAGTQDVTHPTSVVPKVHAQTSNSPLPPKWTQIESTNDEYNYFFRGSGEDRSISTAERLSFDDAVEKATAQVGGRTRPGTNDLRNFIAKFSAVDATWFDYNKSSGSYRYFTRLRLSKEIDRIKSQLGSIDQSNAHELQISNHELRRPIPNVPVYIYVRGIKAGGFRDIAEIYILRTDAAAWGTVTKLPKKMFDTSIKSLGLSSTDDLRNETFTKRDVKTDDSIVLSQPGGQKLKVYLETVSYIHGRIKVIVSE